jgi:Ankyrin repeats (many copies)
MTAFHATAKTHFIPVVRILLQYHADINIQDRHGDTILHNVVGDYDHEENETILCFLLDDCQANYLTI